MVASAWFQARRFYLELSGRFPTSALLRRGIASVIDTPTIPGPSDTRVSLAAFPSE